MVKKKIKTLESSTEYIALGRKLLMVDELPEGALPRYERDICVKSYVIPKKGSVPTSVVEAEELLIPIIEIASHPSIRINDFGIPTNPHMIERARTRAMDSMRRQEDVEVFKVINASVPVDHSMMVCGAITPSSMWKAMATIESHELPVQNIIMHPCRLADLREWGNVRDFKLFEAGYARRTGVAGKFTGATIYVSTMVPKNAIYLLAPPQFVGAIPVRQEMTETSKDDPERMRIGWIFSEQLGFAVINDYAVARIYIDGEHNSLEGRIKQISERLGAERSMEMFIDIDMVLDRYKEVTDAEWRVKYRTPSNGRKPSDDTAWNRFVENKKEDKLNLAKDILVKSDRFNHEQLTTLMGAICEVPLIDDHEINLLDDFDDFD